MSFSQQPLTIAPQGAPNLCFIWMHGLGASQHDLKPLAQQWGSHYASSLQVLPQAPLRPVSVLAHQTVPAWYNIASEAFTAQQDRPGIESSGAYLHGLIDQYIDLGVPSHNIFLLGFSQGAAMALYAGLSYPQPLGGVVACSGYLPLAHLVNDYQKLCQQHLPIHLSAGYHDQVVPLKLTQMSVDKLKDLGYQVSFQSYAMAHEIIEKQLADLFAWQDQILMDAHT